MFMPRAMGHGARAMPERLREWLVLPGRGRPLSPRMLVAAAGGGAIAAAAAAAAVAAAAAAAAVDSLLPLRAPLRLHAAPR